MTDQIPAALRPNPYSLVWWLKPVEWALVALAVIIVCWPRRKK